MWQSWIEIEYYSIVYFEHITELTCCSAELLLREWLICALWTHQILMYLHSTYIWALPLAEIQRYSTPTWWCIRNTWRINIRFFSRTVTYVILIILQCSKYFVAWYHTSSKAPACQYVVYWHSAWANRATVSSITIWHDWPYMHGTIAKRPICISSIVQPAPAI